MENKKGATSVAKESAVKAGKKKEKLNISIPKPDVWKVLTVVLGALLIASVASGGFGQGAVVADTNEISQEEATAKALDFIHTQLLEGGSAELVEATDRGDLYNLKLFINDQSFDSFVTKDGKYLFPQGLEMDKVYSDPAPPTPAAAPSTPPPPSAPTAAAVTNPGATSERPEVELFVMSHCPFGTQMEKGILPVAHLLKDKIDFDIKFVNYAMHGEVEVREQQLQYCIQTEHEDKYLEYLACFLEAGNTDECLTEIGVTREDLAACETRIDSEFRITEMLDDRNKWASGRYPLFLTHNQDNEKYNVRGSPTLVVNGQIAKGGRDSVSLLKTICEGFDVRPEECNTQLEGVPPAPGFGWSESGTNNLAACGG